MLKRKKSHKTKSVKQKKIFRFSKSHLLLVAALTALVGGAYAISRSFAAYNTGNFRLTAVSATTNVALSGVTWNVYAGHLCLEKAIDMGWDTVQSGDYGYAVYAACDGSWENYNIQTATKQGWHPVGLTGYCGVGGATYRYPNGVPADAAVWPRNGGMNYYYICMAPDLVAPTITGADKSQTAITLRWNDVVGAEGYALSRSGVASVITRSSSYTFSGLACGTKYGLSVNAQGYGVTGPTSSTDAYSTLACTPTQPPPPPGPGPGPGPAPGPGPVNHGSPSHTVARAPSTVAPAANNGDTQAPSVPGSLLATENSGRVDLVWSASTDNVGVTAYVVERSTDGQKWDTLSDSVASTNYSDSSTTFGTKYTYRVSAKDAAGNGSDYVLVDITVSGFTANAFADKDSNITSSDGNVAVKIPAGALSEDANCQVTTEDGNAEGLTKTNNLLSGPYTFNCKKKDSTYIDKFNKPIEITVKVESNKNSPKLYAKEGDNWNDSGLKYDNQVKGYSFTKDQPGSFAVATAIKKSSPVLLIVGIVVILLAIVGFVIWFIKRRRLLQEAQTGYDLDYFDNNPPTTPVDTTYPTNPTQPTPPTYPTDPPSYPNANGN